MTAPALVIERYRAHGLKIAVAESLTAGLVAATLADIPGASKVLLGGIVAYQTPLKHRLLGVDARLLESNGAVDPGVAEQMAVGARARLALGVMVGTVGVSTTGVAGPDWQDEQPPGTVYIGLASERGTTSFAHQFRGDRQEIREATVAAALDHLWEYVNVGVESSELGNN